MDATKQINTSRPTDVQKCSRPTDIRTPVKETTHLTSGVCKVDRHDDGVKSLISPSSDISSPPEMKVKSVAYKVQNGKQVPKTDPESGRKIIIKTVNKKRPRRRGLFSSASSTSDAGIYIVDHSRSADSCIPSDIRGQFNLYRDIKGGKEEEGSGAASQGSIPAIDDVIDAPDETSPECESELDHSIPFQPPTKKDLEDTNQLFRDLVITKYSDTRDNWQHDDRANDFPLDLDRSEVKMMSRSLKSGRTGRTSKTTASKMRMDDEDEYEFSQPLHNR